MFFLEVRIERSSFSVLWELLMLIVFVIYRLRLRLAPLNYLFVGFAAK